MKQRELITESEQISSKNWVLMIGMIVTYVIMLIVFIPLWDARDRDIAIVAFLASILFNTALLSGIDHKFFLKKAFWISGVFYLLVPFIAVTFDAVFRPAEIGVELAAISLLFLIKYGIVILPKLKKFRKEGSEKSVS